MNGIYLDRPFTQEFQAIHDQTFGGLTEDIYRKAVQLQAPSVAASLDQLLAKTRNHRDKAIRRHFQDDLG